jgi:hypothetical protein
MINTSAKLESVENHNPGEYNKALEPRFRATSSEGKFDGQNALIIYLRALFIGFVNCVQPRNASMPRSEIDALRR